MVRFPNPSTLAVKAIAGRDYPVVQAVIVVYSLGAIAAKALADLGHRLADPSLGCAGCAQPGPGLFRPGLQSAEVAGR